MTRQEITQFYREHHARLYNIALRILRDPGEAEEAMQDTILKYVSAARSFEAPAQVSAWLARTCMHDAIDRLRRRHHRDAFLADYAAGQEPDLEPEEPVSSLPDIATVRAAMDRLEEPYRLVLNLVLIEGLDYAEIAALTGRREPTLRSLYSRGRAKLIKLLNNHQ